MDCLRDHLTGARAILQARHSLISAYYKSMEYLTLALQHAGEVQARMTHMANGIGCLRNRLARRANKHLTFKEARPREQINGKICRNILKNHRFSEV